MVISLKKIKLSKRKKILAGTIITSSVIAASGLGASAQTTDAIRPFHVNVPEKKLADLKRRILATQWPEQEYVKDVSQSVPLGLILNEAITNA